MTENTSDIPEYVRRGGRMAYRTELEAMIQEDLEKMVEGYKTVFAEYIR